MRAAILTLVAVLLVPSLAQAGPDGPPPTPVYAPPTPAPPAAIAPSGAIVITGEEYDKIMAYLSAQPYQFSAPLVGFLVERQARAQAQVAAPKVVEPQDSKSSK